MGNDLQYGIAKDDSLRMERSLRDSELSYRRLFEAARDGILILNVETGRIDDVNPFLVELLGFSRAEIIGKTVGELSPFKDILSNQAMLKRLQMDRHIRYEDLPLETKDGRKIAVEFVSNVYQSGDKEVIQCNVRDITERRAAEQHLHLLNTCVSHLNEIILVTEAEPLDEPGPKIVYVNEAFERLTGYTAAEAVGRSPRFLQGEKTDRKVLAEIHAALQRREPIKRQVVNYRKDGTEYWMEVNVVPIFDAAGKCTHFAAIERDITEAKKVEAQLLWKTAFFEAQVNSALDAVIVVDSEGKKVLENPQMFALWNHPNEILEEVDHRRRLEWIASLIKNPRQFAEKVAHLYAHPDEVSRDVLELNDGRYLDRYTAPVRGLDGKYFGRIWTYRDITERKRADEGVRRLAAIVESSADAIISKTLDGFITSWNPAAEKMFGYTAVEIIGRPLDILIPSDLLHEEVEILAAVARGEQVQHLETVRVRKDGRRFDVSITISTINNSAAKSVGISKIVRDISERKHLEKQFRQSQKMEAIGLLASGVAHDFNNILAVIQMQADLLKSEGSLSPAQSEFAGEINETVRRGAALTRQLLMFSRKETMQPCDLDLNQSINNVANMLRRILGEDIKLQFKFSMQPLFVHADAGMMDQVLLNLAVNSRDALPKGGQLVIETSAVEFDETVVAQSAKARPGSFVCLSVSDNGCGIPPENLSRIFDPFFTTKEGGKGTGLGLATLFGIVQQH
jgi:PAS domain S-box-containing protein